MGFFDNLFGTATPEPQQPQRRAAERTDDEIAVERYRYLLRTAPPETIESVHAEAFAKLTPAQRDLLFDELTKNAAEGDAPVSREPQALAVSATRSELRNPGTTERSLGGQGMGFGGVVAGSLLGTVAGYVIGSAIVGAFLPDPSVDAGADASADGSAETTDASAAGDTSGADSGFGDGGAGDGGFGGGDFGDFGF